MKLEHLFLNVDDPVAMATWYGEHLGLRTVRQVADAPYTHFLADSAGTMLLEIYKNPPDEVPPYAEMDPPSFPRFSSASAT
jgi:glyoxylase I family protein